MWKLQKADWDALSYRATSELNTDCILNAADPVSYIIDIFIGVANSTIPKSKSRLVKNNTIWFDDDCKEAVKCHRKAHKNVNIHLIPANRKLQNHWAKA